MASPDGEKPRPDNDLPPQANPLALPEGYVAPRPWTPEQIAEWDERHGAIQPGEADAFLERRRAEKDRLRVLKSKGASRMTPAEKDEALDLLLRGVR